MIYLFVVNLMMYTTSGGQNNSLLLEVSSNSAAIFNFEIKIVKPLPFR